MAIINNLVVSFVAKSDFPFIPSARRFFVLTPTKPLLSYFEKALRALNSHLVNRPHLVQRLNDGVLQRSQLTLVSAPTGFGKNTLICEWIQLSNFTSSQSNVSVTNKYMLCKRYLPTQIAEADRGKDTFPV